MKQAWLLLVFLALFIQSCTPTKIAVEKQGTGKWVSLFNGKNLDNWIPKITGYKAGENYNNTFRVENGILAIRYDQYGNFASKFGALYYDKEFKDYRLKVEYRFVGDTTPGAPSWGFRDGGIQYHSQAPATLKIDQPFPVCLEYNFHGGNGTGERPTGEICTSGMYVEIDGVRNKSFCTPPTVQRTFHGDEWVTAEIEVSGEEITHFVNGEKIIAFKNPQYDPAHALGEAFIVNGDGAVRRGYISLQSNSHPMEFRKIEILEY